MMPAVQRTYNAYPTDGITGAFSEKDWYVPDIADGTKVFSGGDSFVQDGDGWITATVFKNIVWSRGQMSAGVTSSAYPAQLNFPFEDAEGNPIVFAGAQAVELFLEFDPDTLPDVADDVRMFIGIQDTGVGSQTGTGQDHRGYGIRYNANRVLWATKGGSGFGPGGSSLSLSGGTVHVYGLYQDDNVITAKAFGDSTGTVADTQVAFNDPSNRNFGIYVGSTVASSGSFDVKFRPWFRFISDSQIESTTGPVVVETSAGMAIHVQQQTREQRTGTLGGQTQGWIWDRRSPEAQGVRGSHTQKYLRWDGSQDGLTREDYRDGVIHGIGYLDTALYPQGSVQAWTPRVEVGWYSAAAHRMPLLSDSSGTTRFDPADIVDDLAYATLSEGVQTPLFVAMYERDSQLRVTPYRIWQQVDTFTGYLDTGTGTRVDAEPAGVPTFTEMDPNKFEFKFDYDTREVILNGPGTLQVGNPSLTTVPVVQESWENKGESVAGRIVYSDYFPIVGDVAVAGVVDDGSGGVTVETYTEVNDWSGTGASDLHFILDRDLGIFYLSGYAPPDQYLNEDIDAAATAVPAVFLPGTEFGNVPGSGEITINAETIQFTESDTGNMYGLTRSAPAAHTQGDVISFTQQGTYAGDGVGETGTIYIAYQAGVRADYETVDGLERRSSNYASWLNLHPLRRLDSDGVLQLSASTLSVDSLELEIDAPLIAAALYGPSFFSYTTNRLTARALDAGSNPVSDIDITISILPDGAFDGPGLLNSQGKSYTGLSNLKGEVYSLYNAPWQQADSETIITDSEFDNTTNVGGLGGNDTVITMPFGLNLLSESDVWLYQILKVDPTLGTAGYETQSGAQASDVDGNYIEFDEWIDPEVYDLGTVYMVDGIGGEAVVEIVNIDAKKTWDSVGKVYTHNTKVYYSGTALVGATVYYVIEKDALQWDPSTLLGTPAFLRGSRVLVYKEEGGAFEPLRPDAFSADKTQLYFYDVELTTPDLDDPSNNVGAYGVVTNRVVSFQAACTDPASGREVQSNIVRLLVRLPPSLIGDHQFESQQSWGFRIAGDSTDASALGGANYWALNPLAQNINRLALTSNIP